MATQIPLNIPFRIEANLDEFIPGNNSQLVQALRDLPGNIEPQQLLVSGPAGCGKTHLLSGLCTLAEHQAQRSIYLPLSELASLSPDMLHGMEQMDLIIFDDLHEIAANTEWELAIFNLYNRAKEQGTHLVFSANQGATSIPIKLPDLKSRIAWGINYQLLPLNDKDKIAFLIQQAEFRGLELGTAAAEYLLTRCPRDTGSLITTFNHLDNASMAAQRKLTIPFIREYLQSLCQ